MLVTRYHAKHVLNYASLISDGIKRFACNESVPTYENVMKL